MMAKARWSKNKSPEARRAIPMEMAAAKRKERLRHVQELQT